MLKVIMIGDVVGDPGLAVLEKALPALIEESGAAFVVVNGENAADGFGMTEANLKRILAAGADAVTSGNHVWEKREFWDQLESEKPILRPANYPEGAPGKGSLIIEKNGYSWMTVNLQGREYMTAINCPFRTFDALFEAKGEAEAFILVDFHAESSREKESLGYYLDGRAQLVVGTHTHIQTSDERILPNGTGYISDLGMTGVQTGIIGMDTKICLDRARSQVLYRMECAKPDKKSPPSIQGVIAEIDETSRRTVGITRIIANS